MSNHLLYEALKGQAYSVLSTAASCDHPKAAAHGYKDGWQMLLDKHDESEMALFCGALPGVLSEAQSRVLLDGLAAEYTQFKTWGEFVNAACDHPDWKPSRGQLP